MLSLRPQIIVSILALSVTFGDSSPKGGASGVPVRPTRDEQSLIFSGTVVLRCLGQQQLDKVRLSRSRCPRKQGPPFCAISGLRRPVGSGPACQWLPLWGQRRRPPPVAETGRSCWGRGQQDASDSEADAGSRNPGSGIASALTERLSPAVAHGQALLRTTSQSGLRPPAPLVGEPPKRQSFAECQGLPSLGEVALRSNDGEVILFFAKPPCKPSRDAV